MGSVMTVPGGKCIAELQISTYTYWLKCVVILLYTINLLGFLAYVRQASITVFDWHTAAPLGQINK